MKNRSFIALDSKELIVDAWDHCELRRKTGSGIGTRHNTPPENRQTQFSCDNIVFTYLCVSSVLLGAYLAWILVRLIEDWRELFHPLRPVSLGVPELVSVTAVPLMLLILQIHAIKNAGVQAISSFAWLMHAFSRALFLLATGSFAFVVADHWFLDFSSLGRLTVLLLIGIAAIGHAVWLSKTLRPINIARWNELHRRHVAALSILILTIGLYSLATWKNYAYPYPHEPGVLTSLRRLYHPFNTEIPRPQCTRILLESVPNRIHSGETATFTAVLEGQIGDVFLEISRSENQVTRLKMSKVSFESSVDVDFTIFQMEHLFQGPPCNLEIRAVSGDAQSSWISIPLIE